MSVARPGNGELTTRTNSHVTSCTLYIRGNGVVTTKCNVTVKKFIGAYRVDPGGGGGKGNPGGGNGNGHPGAPGNGNDPPPVVVSLISLAIGLDRSSSSTALAATFAAAT